MASLERKHPASQSQSPSTFIPSSAVQWPSSSAMFAPHLSLFILVNIATSTSAYKDTVLFRLSTLRLPQLSEYFCHLSSLRYHDQPQQTGLTIVWSHLQSGGPLTIRHNTTHCHYNVIVYNIIIFQGGHFQRYSSRGWAARYIDQVWGEQSLWSFTDKTQ